MTNSVRVAVTQAEPVWIDLAGAIQKTCDLITEAADNGARLVVFPEAWIPGYPCWIWHRSLDHDLHLRYFRNSLKIGSPEMTLVQNCARDKDIAVSLGFAENYDSTLFIAQALIAPSGEIKMHRRKLKPTHVERTIFGDAPTDCLKNVADMPFGRVGSLAGWEHANQPLKFETFTQGEHIHVAPWPPVFPNNGLGRWSMSAEGCETFSRCYAVESSNFVLHCTAVISERGMDAMQMAGGAIVSSPGGGNSAIFGPDGRCLSEFVNATTETIIYADLDMDDLLRPHLAF